MSDRLDPGVLARVLRHLAANRKEGVVRVQTDDAERAIFFRNGFIVRVDSDAPGESLAKTVERAGKVKRVDLELAMTVMKQTGESLGKTMADMALVAPDEVAALELERGQTILRSLLAQTSGTLQFDERALAMGTEGETFRLSVDQVVPEAPPAPQRTVPKVSTPPPSKSPPPPPKPKPASVKSRNMRPPRVAEKRTRGGGGRLLLAGLVLGVVVFGSIMFLRGRAKERGASSRNSAEAAGGLESAATPAAASAVDRVDEGPTDAELFAEATLAFAGDDLEASKATLETLLERSPEFVGAQELLARVDERLANPPPKPVAAAAPPPPTKPEREPERDPPAEAEPSLDPAPPPSAQRLREAKLAFEQGDLAASRQALEALLSADPSHAGARQLLTDVDDAIWQSRLPLSFEVAHNHRFGGCNGTLSLEAWGIGFASDDHAWQWAFGDMRTLERDSRWLLNLETGESDRLSLGGGKNYKFQFENPIPDDDWSRFQRLARR